MEPMNEVVSGSSPIEPAASADVAAAPVDTWIDTKAAAQQYLERANLGEQSAPPAPAEAPATPPQTPGAPAATVSGDETPAGTEDSAMVPSHRLREEAERRRQLEDQVRQYGPYEKLVRTLANAGASEDQVLAALANVAAQNAAALAPPAQPPQAPAATPEERFQAFLAEHQIDPEYASDEILAAMRVTHGLAEQNRELQARLDAADVRTAEQERAVLRSELQTEMQQCIRQYPVLEEAGFQRAVYAQYALAAEQDSRASLDQVARTFAESIEGHTRNALARHSAGKAADARVPVTTGGAAPAPSAPVNVYDKRLSVEDRQQLVAEFIKGAQGG